MEDLQQRLEKERRPMPRGSMKPGDWCCPSCGDLQFAKNAECRRCGTSKHQGLVEYSAINSDSEAVDDKGDKSSEGAFRALTSRRTYRRERPAKSDRKRLWQTPELSFLRTSSQ